MNWYTLSCHPIQESGAIEIIGSSIVPLDSLRNEKVSFSDKLRYEMRDHLVPGWKLHPSFIRISDEPLSDSSDLGKEIILCTSQIYKDDSIMLVRFGTEDCELDTENLIMLISSKSETPEKREDIPDQGWSDMKCFSLYCFLTNMGNDLSVIL